MTDTTAAVVEQQEKCLGCGQTDIDPHFLLMSPTTSGLGWAEYHHDCAAKAGHEKASIIVRATNNATGAELRSQLTDLAHPVHEIVKQHTLREAATIHINNHRVLGLAIPDATAVLEYFASVNPNPADEFVNHVAGLVGSTMSSTKQGRATNFLNVELGSGSFTARTGAIVMELDTAVGSQSANGTPVSGGSYADQTCAFGSASTQTGTYSGQIANSGTPTYTNMPAVTVTSIELKDSAGTAVHLQYGNLTASKTTNSGDTVSAAVGAITVSI